MAVNRLGLFRVVYCCAAIIGLLASCATGPPVELSQEQRAEQFRQKAVGLLEIPGQESFWILLQTEGLEYPEVSRALRSDYMTYRAKKYQSALEDKDLVGAFYELANLRAIVEDSEDIVGMEQKLRDMARETNRWAFLASLADRPEIPRRAESGPASLSDLVALIVEVHLDINWTTEDGIKRRNYNSFSGSGFLIDEKHILTNYHVVDWLNDPDIDDGSIRIRLADGSTVPATLTSWDSLYDLALLTLDQATDCPWPFKTVWGDSELLTAGQTIYSLGNHRGLAQTVTRGIVSAVERSAPEFGTWVQIDANLESGASGGMAVGDDLKIYGMNVAVLSGTDINFIIPSTVILEDLDWLLLGEGPVTRPWLGVQIEKETDSGLSILEIFPSSPLNQWDFRRGETIVSLNGRKIDTIRSAQNVLREIRAGNIASIGIRTRDGELRELIITLPTRPEYPIVTAYRDDNRLSNIYPMFGMMLSDSEVRSIKLTNNNRQYSIPVYAILSVADGSYPDALGVSKGDELGILSDRYFRGDRLLEILHIPAGKKLSEIKNIDDFIFTLEKSHYDNSIL